MQGIYGGRNCPPTAVMGILGTAEDPGLIYENPELWVTCAMEDLAARAEAAVSEKYFVPLCIESALYGVHFIDKILGAKVFFQDGQWYNHYMEHEVGRLEEPDLESNEVWILAKRVAKAFVEQGVTVPLFGLPTIASALNISVNLYGEEMLVALITDPEGARHDLEIINEVLVKIHRWYRSHIPESQLQPVISWERTQPPGYGQICGCTTQLISPELYREFIMKLDEAVLGVYPRGGMIHLCGRHRQMIPLFAQMENLKSVQLNDRAAEDLEYYVRGLKGDQIIYLNPCPGMTIERGLEITGGRRLILAAPYEGGD